MQAYRGTSCGTYRIITATHSNCSLTFSKVRSPRDGQEKLPPGIFSRTPSGLTDRPLFGAYSSQTLHLRLPCDTRSCHIVSAVAGGIQAASTAPTVLCDMPGVLWHSLGRLSFSYTIIPKTRGIWLDSRGTQLVAGNQCLTLSRFRVGAHGNPHGLPRAPRGTLYTRDPIGAPV